MLREINIPKKLKGTGGREKQMRSKHHNAKESERKDARRREGSVVWEEGRSVGGVGGRAKNCR